MHILCNHLKSCNNELISSNLYPHLVCLLADCSKFRQQPRPLLHWELQQRKAEKLLALARLGGKRSVFGEQFLFRIPSFIRRSATYSAFISSLFFETSHLTSSPGGLAPHPRKPAEPFPGGCGAELAIVVTPACGAPGPPPPGVTVAGKLVGVVKAPCSVPGAPAGPPPPPCCRFPIRLQPAWFSAAATRAGFIGRAPMLRPAIPAIGLPLAD